MIGGDLSRRASPLSLRRSRSIRNMGRLFFFAIPLYNLGPSMRNLVVVTFFALTALMLSDGFSMTMKCRSVLSSHSLIRNSSSIDS